MARDVFGEVLKGKIWRLEVLDVTVTAGANQLFGLNVLENGIAVLGRTIQSDKSVVIRIYENTEFTGGVSIPLRNRNRVVSIQDEPASPVNAFGGVVATLDPAKLIASLPLKATRQASVNSTVSDELQAFIFPPNISYVLEVDNVDSGTADVDILANIGVDTFSGWS